MVNKKIYLLFGIFILIFLIGTVSAVIDLSPGSGSPIGPVTPNPTGYKITALYNESLLNIIEIPGQTATTCALRDDLGNLMTSGSFVGSNCTLSGNNSLIQYRDYFVLLDGGGSSYGLYYPTGSTMPINGTNIQWKLNCYNYPTGCDDTDWFGIESIVTELYVPPIPPVILTLNSPDDYYNVTFGTPINFNCSASTTAPGVIENISLYINGVKNYTKIFGGSDTANMIKTLSLDYGYGNWSCDAWDSNFTHNTSSTRYFNLSSTTISLNSPVNYYNTTFGTPIIFNCSAQAPFPSYTIENISLYINGVKNYTEAFGVSDYAELVKSLYLTPSIGNWSCKAWDSSPFSSTSSTRYFSLNYSANTTEEVNVIEGFSSQYLLYVSIDDISHYNVSASLYFNGTSYPTSHRTNYTNYVMFNTTIIVPRITGPLNQLVDWEWKYNVNSNSFSIRNETQNYSQFIFAPYNATIDKQILKLRFKDESTGTYIKATIDSSTWTYIGKSLIFENNTLNPDYYFATQIELGALFFNTEADLQYSSTDGGTYPQRKITLNQSLGSALTTKILYLLDSTHGTTSSYQVISVGNQVIAGAHITVYRTISGNYTMITEGDTDSSGTISFFLNPNYQHTFTVSAPGFATQTQQITPSQSSYTFTLGTSTFPFYYNTTKTEGMSYTKWPPSGIIYDGMYNFTYRTHSLSNNIYNCTMIIEDNNGTILGTAVGCNSLYPAMGNGGQTSLMLNVTNLSKLRGVYYLTSTNNTQIVFETDSYWILMPTNTKKYWTSIRSALNDTLSLPEWGDDPRTTDFSRIVFFFLAFAIVLGAVNFFTNYDTAYPGAIVIVTAFVVLLMSGINGILGPGYFYVELIKPTATNVYLTGAGAIFPMIINNWIVAIHFIMLSAIYVFTTMKRYQAG